MADDVAKGLVVAGGPVPAITSELFSVNGAGLLASKPAPQLSNVWAGSSGLPQPGPGHSSECLLYCTVLYSKCSQD